MKSAKEFIRSVVYVAESSENYVDRRFRTYKNLKRKTSMAIPPDKDSLELAIKRAHLQTSTWLSCCEQNVQTLDPEECGWKLTDGKLKPLWFNGDQFPPPITRPRQGKQTDGNKILKVVTQMTVLLKRNLERRRIIKSKKIKQITREKKGYKKKGNDTKDKLLPPDDSGKEADEELYSVTNCSTAACNTSN